MFEFIDNLLADNKPLEQTTAYIVMQQLNPNAYITLNGNEVTIVEDWVDSEEDGNIYRMGYFSTKDGRHAQAYCLENPFADMAPEGGFPYRKTHLAPSGNICLGTKEHSGPLHQSGYTLYDTVKIARYWCTAFSVYIDTGKFPQPKDA